MRLITDRRLSDTVTALYAIVVGFVGVFLPVSRIIAEAVPGPLSYGLYGALFASGFMTIFGQSTKRMEGPAILMAGLILASTFMIAYAVSALGDRGTLAIAAVSLHLVLAGANLFRIYEVSRSAAIARAAVTRGT